MTEVRTLTDIVHGGKVIYPAGKIIKATPTKDGRYYYVPVEGRGNIVLPSCQFQTVTK